MARNMAGLRRGNERSPLEKLRPEPEPVADVVADPVFDPEALAVQTYGDAGAGFIQGKNYFTSAGKFIRELPKAQWYVTTPEMERNNRIARAKQRARFAGRGDPARRPAADIPEQLLRVQRENAQVLRAESLAE